MPDGFTAEILARAQFAFTVSFHIIFPAFSIGLASFLAVLNAQWLRTADETYRHLFDYWKKIFAVAFGMGVVSGIVMSYQFGTNWSVFSDRTGPVLGPLMAYEVLSAFFLEAGFLGIMLFGREKVGDGLHMFATGMVAFGTLMSATWILSVNSWMHTPAGFGVNDVGQFVPEDWWAVVFNPSFPYRLVHMVLAAYLTTAFVVAGVAGWHFLRGTAGAPTRRMFSMAMWMAVAVTPLQILAGDAHGLNTLQHQPAKVMAMEGHYDSHPDGAPLILFGIPNPAEKRIDYALQIPRLSSLILKHDLNAPLAGLDSIPEADQPPVEIVFFSFRIMITLGFAMLAVGIWGLVQRLRGQLFSDRWLHRVTLVMGPAGFVAVLAGWITTEVGRQPFTVYGLLRTTDSLAPIAAPAVAASLIAFVIVYFFVFGAGTFYILRMMSKPPGTLRLGLNDGPIRSAGVTPAQQTEQKTRLAE
ncbi:cytochrome ubiquinol oxidase subunit I [Puniceibacterium confluentis]|uniref:cytochrome ubiquinol oxidase subunit I n=1 Tax=Puniceibacterium confluentis TaxID=1958944 RepID=UPI0011B5E3F8|nr:cytochrome ubiquinol oxidase subunit I [Puniceibacterium confluentis]